MALSIDINRAAKGDHLGVLTVTLTGSLDSATAPQLEQQLMPQLKSANGVIFDLEHLKFVSSAGLRIFALVRKAMHERGCQTSFINMQPQIRHVFQIMEALPGFSIFASVQEMDDYLAAMQRKHMA